MKLLPLHTTLCLVFLAGQSPQVVKAEAAENSGNKLRRVTEEITDTSDEKQSHAWIAEIRPNVLASHTIPPFGGSVRRSFAKNV